MVAAPDRFNDIGLPADEDWRVTLYFNAPAQTLIAVCRRASSSEKRIFIRHVSERRYGEVVLPIELGFIDDVAVCSGRPLLFLSAWQWRDKTRAAADFAALARVVLPAGVPEPLPQPTLVDTPVWNGPTNPIAIWIEKILGIDPEGRELSIVAAIDVPTGETLHAERAERWVATFDVRDGSTKPIARLLADRA